MKQSSAIDASLIRLVENTLSPLVDQVQDLREEVSILWWHIGGFSRILDKPFTELEPSLAVVMAGLDIADLTRTLAGPAAAPAILERTIRMLPPKSVKKVSVAEAVNAFPEESLGVLELPDNLRSNSDIFPVLAGFMKKQEIGDSPAWEAGYAKAVHLEPSIEISPLALSMQVYREKALLLAE